MPEIKLKVNTDVTFDPADHTYYVDGVRIISVTQVLQALNLVDFSKVPKDVMRFAQLRGSYVHRAVELYLKDMLDPSSVDQKIQPYLESFVLWYRNAEGIDIHYLETPMVNITQGYAGTPDLIGMFKDEPVLIDWKSGITTPEIRLAQRLQTAAYAKFLDDEPRRFIVELQKDGSMAKLTEHTNTQDKYLWDSAVSLYHAGADA